MRELLLRTVSGLLYAALIVFSAYWSPLAFLVVLGTFSILALFEFQKLIGHKSPITFLFFGLLAYHIFNQTVHPLLHYSLLFLTLSYSLYLTYCLFTQKKYPAAPLQRTGLSFFYLIGSAYFILSTTLFLEDGKPLVTLLMYILIWTNNSTAYLIGKRWGKNLLLPAISPKKTWEGFWGGLLGSLVLSLLFLLIFEDYPFWFFPFLALFIAISATLGDLIQSKFKREAHVKDSGSLLPGHGGFFDRMDSVLYTAPFVYLLFKFSFYVS
ncbi:MAG: phosphatidate cytidylyltransferase [Flavobacteriaceae bacterium]